MEWSGVACIGVGAERVSRNRSQPRSDRGPSLWKPSAGALGVTSTEMWDEKAVTCLQSGYYALQPLAGTALVRQCESIKPNNLGRMVGSEHDRQEKYHLDVHVARSRPEFEPRSMITYVNAESRATNGRSGGWPMDPSSMLEHWTAIPSRGKVRVTHRFSVTLCWRRVHSLL